MVTRISGMASGMDVDTIVKGLMDAQRVPLNKLNQKKTYTEWQRDDYRTINTALSEFDTLIFNGVGMQKSFLTKTVTVSQPDAVSVKNLNSTSDFSGEINVTKVASAATMVSTGKTDIDDSTKTLQGLGIAAQKITIEAINKDGAVSSYSLDIASTDTLDSVISKINANSGVTVFYDKTSQRFSITAQNTGDATGPEIKLSSDSSTTKFFDKLKMAADSDTAVTADVFADDNTTKIGKAGTAGVNASLTYNGLSIKRSSNTFTINGAEITLKKGNVGPVTFSSSPDVDTIYDTIKKFVDSYNGLIANISDKISEKKNADYPPLTDAQKKDMKDTDITLWETQAKKGTLRNDSTLSSLLTKMRSSIYSSVSNTSFGNLSKIGISTTSNYLDGGKLQIDEKTLRAAISKDPNGIYKLFTSGGDETSESEKGVTTRLRANLKSAMTDISTKAGKTSSVNNTFTLGRLLTDYTTKIASLNDRLTSLETRYYNQFTAMEKAIQNANSQSTSLTSYLGK